MPGLNKEQLALVQAQVDMYTKHNLLMRKIYDKSVSITASSVCNF